MIPESPLVRAMAPPPRWFSEMHASMCEDLAEVGMSYRRVDLIRTLDHFIGQSERGQVPLGSAVGEYLALREALLAAEKGASDILTGMRFRTIAPFRVLARAIHTGSHSTFVCALPLMFLWFFCTTYLLL